MSSSQVFVTFGIVVENLPNTMFRVRIDDASHPEIAEKVILCHLAGKMRMHYVKLLPGDRIKCEINPLDLSKGRIVFKIK
jgi:translation initiation factor IF-1